jgi:predicted nucleotidyltransferase component of viral defense system
MKPSETKKNIISIINDYSQEFGIAPYFVEKDYYVVKVLSEINKIDYPDLKIVFSGGTCLSKAYHRISRFSEDIDFRIHTERLFTRAEKKAFCNFILEKLDNREDYHIIQESIKKGNENNFFSFEIEYEKLYEGSNLRPNVKVEFTFENLILPSTVCEISSFIGNFINEEPIKVNCIQPIEVIANKFSALMWRVYIKDRTKPLYSKENDPTIVRHLHDIAALEDLLYTKEFVELLQKSFESDKGRGGFKNNYTLPEVIKITLDKLTEDKIYQKEFTDFVGSMCYAKDSDVITFVKAFDCFERLYQFINNKN